MRAARVHCSREAGPCSRRDLCIMECRVCGSSQGKVAVKPSEGDVTKMLEGGETELYRKETDGLDYFSHFHLNFLI